MVKKTEKLPPLLVVSGAEEFLRLRFLRQFIASQRADGWSVSEVDGTDPIAVRDVLDGEMFGSANTLGVVSLPEKVNLDVIKQHAESKTYDVTLLLHVNGEVSGKTKFGKYVKDLAPRFHRNFEKPTDWNAPKVAASFVLSEVRLYQKEISSNLADAVVSHVGIDLGVLAFEVQKMALLADSKGVAIVDRDIVKGAVASITEASVAPIIDALGVRSLKRLSRAMVRVRRTSKVDPTMRICRFIGPTVLKWAQATYLDALPPSAAAAELGIHPWYFENKILPPAQRWGRKGIAQLVSDLAASERAVLNGALDPWLVLTSRLLSSCKI